MDRLYQIWERSTECVRIFNYYQCHNLKYISLVNALEKFFNVLNLRYSFLGVN